MNVKKLTSIVSFLQKVNKKHKIATNLTLLFLTVSLYFLRDENKTIRYDYSQIEIAFARISEKQKAFINTVILYNRTYKKFPIPIWQKVKRGDRFVMQYVNPKYEEVFGDVFGNDVRNIIGSDNFELGYPYEIAKRYYDTDMRVALTGKVERAVEFYMDSLNVKILLDVRKWRDIRERDTLIYGMAEKKKR